jgi:hypothetical protein
MGMSNTKRAKRLADLRVKLESAYNECEELYSLMGGDNSMSRCWSRKVTDPVGEAITFIDEIEKRAIELGLI